MLRIGIAGIGFMGVTHFHAWRNLPDTTVVAICSRSRDKLEGRWSGIKGNFGGDGGVQDMTGIRAYERYEDLLADPEIDLIDNCLPTPAHVSTVIAAFEAGKHVLVEKPIALTLADADRMIDAARSANRLLYVAHVLRFMPEWRMLYDVARSGCYGRLMTLHLKRVISRPRWSRSIADLGANGGPLIDLHIHDADFVLHMLGAPSRVYTQGVFATADSQACPIGIGSVWTYDAGPVVTFQGGAVAAKARPFQHGFEACFEKATVVCSRATEPTSVDPAAKQSGTQVLTVYDEDGGVTFPTPPAEDAFTAQLSHVATCLRRGEPSPWIDGRCAKEALRVVLIEAESIRSGQVCPVGQ